jgi:hypothetical protein
MRMESPDDYLVKHRLQWGRPDSLSLLPSTLDVQVDAQESKLTRLKVNGASDQPAEAEYFTTDISPESISIIQNDWPFVLLSL